MLFLFMQLTVKSNNGSSEFIEHIYAARASTTNKEPIQQQHIQRATSQESKKKASEFLYTHANVCRTALNNSQPTPPCMQNYVNAHSHAQSIDTNIYYIQANICSTNAAEHFHDERTFKYSVYKFVENIVCRTHPYKSFRMGQCVYLHHSHIAQLFQQPIQR